jgi:hypothetical protein
MEALDKVLTAPLGPDRETWGMTPDAVEASSAMEALAGGPASPRR